jgi:hypothetical protein
MPENMQNLPHPKKQKTQATNRSEVILREEKKLF